MHLFSRELPSAYQRQKHPRLPPRRSHPEWTASLLPASPVLPWPGPLLLRSGVLLPDVPDALPLSGHAPAPRPRSPPCGAPTFPGCGALLLPSLSGRARALPGGLPRSGASLPSGLPARRADARPLPSAPALPYASGRSRHSNSARYRWPC